MRLVSFLQRDHHGHRNLSRSKNIGCIILIVQALMLFFSVPFGQAQTNGETVLPALRWRLVGPLRAGWASVAAGIPEQPNTFYFGAVAGGVWKTDNAGRTWQPLMQHENSASVGALDVSESNPNILYVGTGQVTMRYDIVAGDGVYRSDDGGKTWKHTGLTETRHIGRILIDPRNSNRVLVAAMGHAFDSNPERGVYLTNDGGKNWRQVLFVNEETGAVDLAWDPEHPAVVYAALWQFRQHPWLDYFQPQEGPGSAIYKSEDGGEHWQRLSGKGLPVGPLGRIGLETPRGGAGRIVYATVAASKGAGFYRSDDSGQTWQLLNKDPELSSDYFCRVTVAPDNPQLVYVMARSIHRSDDGGRHFTISKGSPGGDDYHFLWINPRYPDHMITAADQGTVVTVDGGQTWSSWYNQPTGQFYHLAADDQFPYKIYSGQQDNGTVEIASRGPYGVIEERDWRPVGGDERDYEVPKPGDPNLVFGSGLGGYVSRANQETHQVANVSPWPVSSYGAKLNTVRYRYTWITPLAFSPTGRHALYFGAQVLFRSLDDGDHWEIISPDLSAKKENAQNCDDPGIDEARDCGYGVIYTIAPSPTAEDVIWVGTDDGLIHLTTDAGVHWQNVTPKAVAPWGRIDAIAPSPFSEHAAYAAVDLHRTGDFTPLILKTGDEGRSWQKITTGLPANQFVFAVRTDPRKEGLLYAGTNRSVYVSFDDGGHWQSLALNLPTTSVRDLLVHNGDLIAGTQGRGIWVLDNLAPLRERQASLTEKPVHLFQPASAWRLRSSENHDTPPPPDTPLGQNPPTGAIIDYWLKHAAHGSVTLTFRDQAGQIVRTLSSDDKPEHLTANRYFQAGWIAKEIHLSNEAGMHRFVWDLRYARPAALEYNYKIAAVWHDGTPLAPEGPLVLPGRYTVTLNVDGKDYTQPFTVKLDPRVQVRQAALQQQLELARSIDKILNQVVTTYHTVENALKSKKKKQATGVVIDSLATLLNKGHPSLASVAGVLANLATAVQMADAAPTQGQQEVFSQCRKQFDALLKRWHNIQ
ncbi:MAG: WD40/YVTN/BNR-like repeat-containing protein [bacterium]